MTKFVKQNAWLLTVVALLSLATTGVSWLLIDRQNRLNSSVEHTLDVMSESDQALICLMDCETAYRGYLITSDKAYLEPYQACYRHVDAHLRRLQSLTLDDPTQQSLMPRLFQLANGKIAFSQQAIAIRSANDPSVPGRSLVELTPGKILMDKFRDAIQQVRAKETMLLEKRKSDSEHIRNYIYMTIAALSGLLLTLLFQAVIVAKNYAERQAIDKERLESLVSERTEELKRSEQSIREVVDQRTEQLRQALDKATEANALKSKFVSTISHEVRTPLSGIIGLAEYLTTIELQPHIAEVVGHIYRSSEHLLAILNDLLDFSKLEAGKVDIDSVVFDPRGLVGEVVALFQQEGARKGIAIVTEFNLEVPAWLRGDQQKLRQILTNILSNAVKFTEAGNITILTELESLTIDTMNLRIAVSDTGIGINSESQQCLFQPFTQADSSMTRRFGGTGLGLSISKSYVDMLGGEIGFQSNPGKGSTFWFSVPIRRENSES